MNKVVTNCCASFPYLAGGKEGRHIREAASRSMSWGRVWTLELSRRRAKSAPARLRTLVHRGIEPQIYFWRTATGTEVDFVIEHDQKLIPVEVKVPATPRPQMAAGISAFRTDLGRRASSGYVTHASDVRLPLGPDAIALPFRDL